MKANRHITAIITVLFIGFSTLNGQASARTEKRDNQAKVRQVRATQTQERKVKTNHTNARQSQAYTGQTRKVQSKQANTRQSQAYTAKTRQANATQNKGKGERYTTRYNQTATANRRPVSMSTNHNPKSNYGGNHNKNHVKRNKYSEKHYYGGKHYHNAYPAHKVRPRYHYNTHMHHYNVLYYPSYNEIYWNRSMYNNYHRWYPNYRWTYNYGHRIYSISVFDAKYNLGEVAMVYGRVYASWHNKETDDYLLFFGGDYPTQHFTVVLPGRIARKFSWRPERYFPGEHMTITGLITTFDGIPEIVVKNRTQVGIY